jgi:NAD(P)-dependent dehydrogenase (short-subunit alcohol dehydrogenase family)
LSTAAYQNNMREAWGRVLVTLGEKNTTEVETELGKSTRSIYFTEAFRERYFETGIAEQKIVSTAICGLIGHRYTNEAYTTTKGAITLLSKSITVRYANDDIRCNSVHPSTVDTPSVRTVLQDSKRQAERQGEVPLGQLIKATDVANAVVFLASEEAAFINGYLFPG